MTTTSHTFKKFEPIAMQEVITFNLLATHFVFAYNESSHMFERVFGVEEQGDWVLVTTHNSLTAAETKFKVLALTEVRAVSFFGDGLVATKRANLQTIVSKTLVNIAKAFIYSCSAAEVAEVFRVITGGDIKDSYAAAYLRTAVKEGKLRQLENGRFVG